MTDYQLTFSRPVRKELESLSLEINNRIFTKIVALGSDPRPDGCRKLVGEENLWRIRIGDYRVIYSINDDTRIVDIIAVRHRSKAYES